MLVITSIILNWNNSQATIDCAKSLLTQSIPSDSIKHRILIVDNGSGASDRNALTSWLATLQADIELHCCGNNLGFARGMNAGIRRAIVHNPDYFWLLNNDTNAAPNALSALAEQACSNPEQAILGATIINPRTNTVQTAGGYRYINQIAWHRPIHANKSLQDIATLPDTAFDYVDGAAIFASAKFLKRTGGLPEASFMYFEELRLARSLLLMESQSWCRQAIVYHGTEDRNDVQVIAGKRSYHAALAAFEYTNEFHRLMLPTVMMARVFASMVRSVLALRIEPIRITLNAVYDFFRSSGR